MNMRDYPTGELQAVHNAIAAELANRKRQLEILADALDTLHAAGANGAVLDCLYQAIDIIDASTVVDTAEADEPPAPEPELTNRQKAIADLRSLGYVAPGYDQLVRLYHRDVAEMEYLRAEADTRGHMTKRQHAGKYNARNLWFCNLRELRKYASDEMLTWFDTHGRITYRMLRDQMDSGQHYAGSGYINNR